MFSYARAYGTDTGEGCWSHDADDQGPGMMDHDESSETDYDAYPHC